MTTAAPGLAAHHGAFSALLDAVTATVEGVRKDDPGHPDAIVLDQVQRLLAGSLPAPREPDLDPFGPPAVWEAGRTFLSEWVETWQQADLRDVVFDQSSCAECGASVGGFLSEGEYGEDRGEFRALLVVTELPSGDRHYLCEDCAGPTVGPSAVIG